MARGIDVVFRLHQQRDNDFCRGHRLGHGDHVVVWHKPAKPRWMDAEQYAALPDTLTIREVRYAVNQPGFRVREIDLATTLLDAEAYSADDLADLYHQRWHAELDLRSLKTTMKMDMLRCQTPATIERELETHILGYNVVRKAPTTKQSLPPKPTRTRSRTPAMAEAPFPSPNNPTLNAAWCYSSGSQQLVLDKPRPPRRLPRTRRFRNIFRERELNLNSAIRSSSSSSSGHLFFFEMSCVLFSSSTLFTFYFGVVAYSPARFKTEALLGPPGMPFRSSTAHVCPPQCGRPKMY